MKSKATFHFRDQCRRLLAVVVAATMLATLAQVGAVSAAEPEVGETAGSSYNVVINETVTNGFTHPGVGVTKAVLENIRTQVLAQKEPWYSYYKAMTVSSSASKTVTSSNQSSLDPTKPAVYSFDSQGFNQRFIQDGLKAYTQSLMYYITGDEVYRANAMHIIRIWSKMDPAQFVYFNDAHIHTGIPLNRMATAAEILRYSSYQTEELKWTDKDTADFTNNLITPAIETFMHENSHFMNQHNYPLLGAMAGYIFTDNRERYNEAVEWATVNKTATNQGFNGSIKQLFRLIDTNAATGEQLDKPVVQHVEMGRDQAHGAGDLTNSAILSRMFIAQGTKVDPVEGTVSTQDNAVGYYEFLDDRFLAAADFFGKYMLGYNTPWVPVPFSIASDGTVKGIYQKFSDSYRGRTNTAQFWDMYYYYTYVKGINVAEKAPYFYEAFTKRIPSNYYYQGNFSQAWESVDGGGDFWLYIPKEAESEGTQYLPKEQPSAALVEIEDRYTAFDNNTATVLEGDTSYVQTQATVEGSQYVVQNLSYANRTNSRLIGLKIRTNGPAVLELSKDIGTTPYHTLTLPDTKGEWKYVTYDMGLNKVSFGQLDGDYSLLYMNVKGAGTTVDVDHINVKAGEQLTPPAFNAGNSDLNIFAFNGASVNLDLSAVDSNPADVIAYEITNKPEGVVFNASTGAFSWQPTQAGTYSLIAEAFDGTTLVTKNVKIVVSDNRTSAVAAATDLYNPSTSYVKASLDHFQAVYDETVNLIETASDEAFYQQLLSLRSAVNGLQLLTPALNSDGSMDYTNIVTSTFGNAISLLVDGNDNTYPIYTLALYPNLYHILDFGADFKLSAEAFGLEGRMNFTDRMAGMTVFGSNDGDNWTRITSGQTPFVDDMARLEVDAAYKNEKFRLIKIEMIDPQPDVLRGSIQKILELSEFRIYGERHEIGNKLESVSIGSNQSVNGRILLGDTVKVTIKAKEAINNVTVKIQGQDAAVSTQDNINWTAEATLNQGAATGPVKFSIDYQKDDGTNGETTYFTTDNSKLYLADESKLIHNVTSITKLIDSTTSSGRTAAETLKQTNYLFDNDSSTSSDYRLNGGGSGSYITFDFKAGNEVTLSSVEVLARQDNNLYSRIRGAVVQGSNDNVAWTTISKEAKSTAEWQTLAIAEPAPYRYIRMINPNGWFGNMAELRFHGVVVQHNKVESAVMSSAQSLKNRIVSGNTVQLTFKAREAINNVKVAIQGQEAVVSTQDNINFTAVATMNQGAAKGPVTYAVNYKLQDGTDGYPAVSTAEDATLYLADDSDVIQNVTGIATLLDSTSGRAAAETLKQTNYLFDGDLSTNSDYRLNGTGTGSYITFDFKEGNQATISGVEMLARQDNNLHLRMFGTVVQGSNDNTTWSNLTTAAVVSTDWQSFTVSGAVPYRYIRIYNPLTWFGNIAELRLHGNVKTFNKIESASISSEQSLKNRVVPGNTVKLAFKAKEAINNVTVKIQGQEAVVSTQDNINFTAVATMNQGAAAGPVAFAVKYKQQDGTDGYTVTSTTDSTKLFLADESDVIRNVTSIANFIDSTTGRTAAQTLQQVSNMFDSSLITSSDFRLGSSSGVGGYIIFDFKQGNQATLSGVELIGRQESILLSRIVGTVVQGSNDNTTWTTLTAAAVSSADWQSFAVSSKVPYRYIRIYNPFTWFGNIVELRLHGAVKAADLTAPVTTDDAPQAPVSQNTKVSFNAVDPDSGIAATYYTVDGGAQQTGNSVTLTAEGTHTLVYWSVDFAGNIEASHTIVVNIDKTAPVDAALSADITAPTNSNVIVTVSYPDDAAVKEYKVGDSGAWTAYGAPVVVSENSTVFARGTDAAGNISNVASYAVSNIDHIAPVDAILAVDTTAPTNQGVTVTISYPADADVLEYKVGDNGVWTAYTAPVVVSDNDTVYARGTDAVGNVSNITSITLSNIYKLAPVTTATLNPGAPNGKNSWYTTDVAISLSVSASELGGAVTTEYQVNDGAWISYNGTISAFGEGIYKFAYRSKDQAGNVEQLKTVEFKVDKTAPALSVQLDQTTIWPGNHKMVTVNATLNSSDATSGVESVVLTSITSSQPDSGLGDIEADFGTAAASFSLRAEQSCIYTITYTATDKAGNITVESVIVTVPHDQS